MRRALATLLTGAFLILGTLSFVSVAAAATIAPITTCSNGVDNTPGLGLICDTTIVNTITTTGGSAMVTVRECHGAAGDPEASCTNETVNLTEPVTEVNQCNDSTNGGGGVLRCRVRITNNFVEGDPASTAVTVNQCVGSGGGVANDCDPFPATTTSATITQCNGSANGGTLVDLTCVATGTESAVFSVLINQCNDSTNGGGAVVRCSANIETNAIAPSPSPTPTTAPAPTGAPTAGPTAPAGGGSTPRPTTPATDAVGADDGTGSGPMSGIVAGLLLLGAAFVVGRRSLQAIRARS